MPSWIFSKKLRIAAFNLLFAGGLVAWKFWQSNWQAMWLDRWAIVWIFVGLGLAWRIRSFSLRAFLIYALVRSSIGVENFLMPIDDQEIRIAARSAMQDHLIDLFALFAFLTLRPNITRALKYSSCLGMILILTSAHPRIYVNGLMNPSMASVFVVLASGVYPLSILAPILCHSWTGALCWAAGALYGVRKYISRQDRVTFAVLGILVIVATPHLFPGRFPANLNLWDIWMVNIPDNGRFTVWNMAFQHWLNLDPWSQVLGTGPGTFRILEIVWGFEHPYMDHVNVMPWLHNDYLQAILEYGLLGSGLALCAAIGVWRRLKETNRVIFIALSVAMLFNFPWHLANTAIIAWGLILASNNERLI